ncbi:MAG: DUF488 domain-containing protein [Candidatus Dormiibacterota bacterium]
MPRLLTIGHSTRSLDELVELLHQHGVELLVDVRSVPASRRMPHFARASLERSLPAHRIAYLHMPELGGLRKPNAASINTGWRNVSFRGYADYMQTIEFWRGIDRLMSLPSRRSAHLPVHGEVAIMCAEAVPWRCHRSLVSDALTIRGCQVSHITGKAEPARHSLTPFARVENGRITYPPPDTLPI